MLKKAEKLGYGFLKVWLSQNLGSEIRESQRLHTHLRRSRARVGMHRRIGVSRFSLLAKISAGEEIMGRLGHRPCIFFFKFCSEGLLCFNV